MNYIDAIILGILQGLTEFLPISSSGHLVLAQAILDVKEPGVSFELLVHLGTVAAILIYFRSSISLLIRSLWDRTLEKERRVIGYLIIGTVPAGLAGVLLEDFFDRAFSAPVMTALMLFATGALLLLTRFVPKQEKPVTLVTAVIMGVGQALAILPGISRSGSTIATGMIAGVEPSEAAEFSFLLAIPAILGAVVLKADELVQLNTALLGQYLVGTVFAFGTGLVAVYFLLSVIRRGKLDYFAWYCFAAGGVGLYIFL